MAGHSKDDQESDSDASSFQSEFDDNSDAGSHRQARRSLRSRFFDKITKSGRRKSKAKSDKGDLGTQVEKSSLEDVLDVNVASASKLQTASGVGEKGREETTKPAEGSASGDGKASSSPSGDPDSKAGTEATPAIDAVTNPQAPDAQAALPVATDSATPNTIVPDESNASKDSTSAPAQIEETTSTDAQPASVTATPSSAQPEDGTQPTESPPTDPGAQAQETPPAENPPTDPGAQETSPAENPPTDPDAQVQETPPTENPSTDPESQTQETPPADNQTPQDSSAAPSDNPAPPVPASDAPDSSRELAVTSPEPTEPSQPPEPPESSENLPENPSQEPTTPLNDRFRYSRWSRFQRADQCTHAPLIAGFIEEGRTLNIKMPPPVSVHGRKKAVCIGINYHGSEKSLKGCANDALNMKDVLTEYMGFKSGDVDICIDYFPFEAPTRKRILQALKDLVDGAEPGDSLFLHYSGHGGQINDTSGDEKDGEDEVIYPVDWKHPKKGPISDDELYRILVENLPEGCHLFAIFDSCHSGSILDLPYMLGDDGELHPATDITHKPARHTAKPGGGKVILFSGCQDGQTSADTKINGAATGAMSHAFVEALEKHEKPTYLQILEATRAILKDKYSQKPQLSVSRMMDMKEELFKM